MGLKTIVLVAALAVGAAGCGAAGHSSASSASTSQAAGGDEAQFCAQLEAAERNGSGLDGMNALMAGVAVDSTPWAGPWQTFLNQSEVGNGDAAWPAFAAVVAGPCRSLGFPI